jgi:uncharacterized protein (DUF302 family)
MPGTTPPYGLKTTLDLPVDEAEDRVREELSKEGFGVLTRIDVREIFADRLDVDFRPYVILGACNPGLAHQALSEDTDLGLLLPCNVVVYRSDLDDETVVTILDPETQLSVSGREDIVPLAREVRHRMERVLAAL